MFAQISIGTALMLATILVAGVSFWVMEVALVRGGPWLARRPHRPKLLLILCGASVWILGQFTVGVWLWALTFFGLGVFDAMEPSLYFALVAVTTLGFGDILLPEEWRLLAGMAAANGLLNMGLMTAILVEALRQVRTSQRAALEGR